MYERENKDLGFFLGSSLQIFCLDAAMLGYSALEDELVKSF